MNNKFLAVCQAFSASDALSNTADRPEPAPFDIAGLSTLVLNGRDYMPKEYTGPYADALMTSFKNDAYVQALTKQYKEDLNKGVNDDEASQNIRKVADAVTGAVADWKGDAATRVGLNRFLRVAHSIYKSVKPAANPNNPDLPPLVTFAPTLRWGPHTLNPMKSREVTGAPIAVVSMPYTYQDHPLLWSALAHEVGGHDALHRRDDIVAELKTQLQNHYAAIDALHGWNGVWLRFVEEAMADVCGVLAMGPSFAVSLLAWLSAVQRIGIPGPVPVLGTVGTHFRIRAGEVQDDHPPDLLRIYVAMGVVDALTYLSPASKQQWIETLTEVAEAAAGGATTIDSYNENGALALRYPLEMLAASAREAGKFIATVKLITLSGQSIQDLKTWTDDDEAAASAFAAVDATLTPLQLLAGATMALYDQKADYATLSSVLNQKL